jgi:hypothetical protein
VFGSWSAGCTTTAVNPDRCSFTMGAGAKTLSASFTALHLLQVTRAGSGTGGLTYRLDGSDLTMRDCTGIANCKEASVLHGKSVTISAAPANGASVSWNGCTSTGSNGLSCTVSMTAQRSITASFSLPMIEHPLTVQRSGSGAGTIRVAAQDRPEQTCAMPSCTYSYSGNSVTLTAAASSGSVFLGWSGDMPENSCVSTGPCTVTMTQARTVTARFGAGVALTYTMSGDGSGEIVSSNQVLCTRNCTLAYAPNARVRLTAKAAPGSIFAGWSEDCRGKRTCSVRMRGERKVTATFLRLVSHNLTITRDGNGSGGISVSGGVRQTCSATSCTYAYPAGTSLTLTARPERGTDFAGWSSPCSGTARTCKLTMSEARTVRATFSQPISHNLALTIGGPGSVKLSAPRQRSSNCTANCTRSYRAGTEITLTAIPQRGMEFAGWSSHCSGTALACTLTMSEARNVAATFRQPASHDLTLVVEGSGSVTLSTPRQRGANCTANCTKTYRQGTDVTLTAKARRGWVFDGWSGEVCTGNGACSLPMTEARDVTARFRAATPATIMGGLQ